MKKKKTKKTPVSRTTELKRAGQIKFIVMKLYLPKEMKKIISNYQEI